MGAWLRSAVPLKNVLWLFKGYIGQREVTKTFGNGLVLRFILNIVLHVIYQVCMSMWLVITNKRNQCMLLLSVLMLIDLVSLFHSYDAKRIKRLINLV